MSGSLRTVSAKKNRTTLLEEQEDDNSMEVRDTGSMTLGSGLFVNEQFHNFILEQINA